MCCFLGTIFLDPACIWLQEIASRPARADFSPVNPVVGVYVVWLCEGHHISKVFFEFPILCISMWRSRPRLVFFPENWFSEQVNLSKTRLVFSFDCPWFCSSFVFGRWAWVKSSWSVCSVVNPGPEISQDVHKLSQTYSYQKNKTYLVTRRTNPNPTQTNSYKKGQLPLIFFL